MTIPTTNSFDKLRIDDNDTTIYFRFVNSKQQFFTYSNLKKNKITDMILWKYKNEIEDYIYGHI